MWFGSSICFTLILVSQCHCGAVSGRKEARTEPEGGSVTSSTPEVDGRRVADITVYKTNTNSSETVNGIETSTAPELDQRIGKIAVHQESPTIIESTEDTTSTSAVNESENLVHQLKPRMKMSVAVSHVPPGGAPPNTRIFELAIPPITDAVKARLRNAANTAADDALHGYGHLRQNKPFLPDGNPNFYNWGVLWHKFKGWLGRRAGFKKPRQNYNPAMYGYPPNYGWPQLAPPPWQLPRPRT